MKVTDSHRIDEDLALIAERIARRGQGPYPMLDPGLQSAWILSEWLELFARKSSEQAHCFFAGEPAAEAGFLTMRFSPWDSGILGRQVWQIVALQAWQPGALQALLGEARARMAPGSYLFGRLGRPWGDAGDLQALGCNVVERLERWGVEAEAWHPSEPAQSLVPLTAEDLTWAADLAVRARNPADRYHADPALAPSADAFMRRWVLDGFAGFCDRAFKVCVDGHDAGFALWQSSRLQGPGLLTPARLVLGAVEPSMQGRGAYRSLTIGGGNAMLAEGARHLEMSTQAENIGAAKAWNAAGLNRLSEWLTFSLG